jgi:D-alanyl-lipoteichoic acid acyltransferase DltB (MBOAT superfamily)
VGLLLALAIFHHLPGRQSRQAFLGACNAGFLYLLIPNGVTWLILAAFLLSGYFASMWLKGYPNRLFFGAYLVLLLTSFIFLKKYEFLHLVGSDDILAHPIAIIGLSYMLFRQIHFIVDAMQGQIKSLSLWAYLNYQLQLFTLLAGPIQRFQNFQTYWAQPGPLLTDRHELMKAYLRVLTGMIKILVFAEICLALSNASLTPSFLPSGGFGYIFSKLPQFYLYPAYVYFNFAGYCDIVIGGAALFGMKLPENFDRPYLARNMIDFWSRWHKTLTFWIRDYLFTPIYKAIAESWPRRANSLVFLVYFVALFFAGVWHGSTFNFLVFGLMHGIGVSAAKIWEDFLIQRRGRSGLRNYMKSKRMQFIATVFTFHFTCAAFLFFPEKSFDSFREQLQFVTSFLR